MSSDRPSGDPSPEPERQGGEFLLQALQERVPGARAHADSTASYAFATAAELGLERETCLELREAARLHEVGKLYVPAMLLARPRAELSPQQAERVESHHSAGQRLARGAGVPEQACEWILHAGERFDAGGEPPLPSRIIAASCAYDGLLAELAEQGDAGRRWALIGVIEMAGGALDPMVVDALARVVERAAGTVSPRA